MPPAIATVAAIYAITEVGRWAVKQDILPDEFGTVFGYYEPESLDLHDQTRPGGYQVNKRSNVAPIPVVYGERVIGGTAVFLDNNTLGSDPDPILWLAMTLCEGEVEEIVNVYLDSYLSSDSRWTVDGSEYVTMWSRDGTDDQEYLPGFSIPFPWGYLWNENHRLAGTAYLFFRFRWNSGLFNSGLPRITAQVKGQKLYDPDTSTTAWGSNPAHVIRDYLTNTRYGCGWPESMIYDQSFIDAADYCDEESTSYDDGGNRKRYTCNGIVDVDKTPLENIRRLLTSCRGMLIFSGGQYKLICDKPETSVFNFTTDNIVGNWSISLRDKTRICNRVKVRYFDENRDWQPNICIVDSPDLRADEDNGEVIEKEIELPFTSTEGMARQLATIYLNQSRQGLQVQLTATMAALKCDIGDVVDITHPTPGWTGASANKEFRVTNMRIKNTEEIDFTLSEYGGTASYSWDQILLYDPAPDTGLPDPYTVTNPGQPELSHYWYEAIGSGLLAVLRAEWAPSLQTFVDYYEVRYKWSLGPVWIPVGRFSPSDTVAEIHGLIPRNYVVQVRTVNTFGAVSDWVQSEIYPISAISGTPSDITGLTITNQGGSCLLSWDAIDPTASAPDHDVTVSGRIRIRFTTQSANWNNGLETNIQVAGSANNAIVPMAADGAYMVKAVTSYGIESTNAATIESAWVDNVATELADTINLHDLDGDAPTDYWDNGALTNTEIYSAFLRLPESSGQITEMDGDWTANIDAAYLLNSGVYTDCRVTLTVNGQSYQVDNTLISTRGLVSTWPSVAGADTTNAAAYAEVFVRGGSTPGTLAVAEWHRIINFMDITSRYFQFKVVLHSDSVDYGYRMWSAIAKVYKITTAAAATTPGVY